MALAVDWVTSNLYWSSSQKPGLHVTSPLGSYTTLLLQGALKVTAAHLNSLLRASCFFCARQHLCCWILRFFSFSHEIISGLSLFFFFLFFFQGTTSVALHPPSGRLCYTAIMVVGGKSQAEVTCAWMDGRNKVVLWTRSSLPTSVAFSDQGSVIYWADTGEEIKKITK